MKSILKTTLILGILLGMASISGAYSMYDIEIGDELMVTDYNRVNNAGEYDVVAMQEDSGAKTEFTSWCAEHDDYLWLNTPYEVISLTIAMDQSTYLLTKYYNGDFNLSDPEDQAAFQEALWSYDSNKQPLNNNYNYQVYTTMADEAVRNGFVNQGNILIADLGDFQNLYVPRAPVPEPATMLLMGTGLLGLATLGRRKFFKR